MALVAYDNSDSSELEDEDSDSVPTATLVNQVEEPSSSASLPAIGSVVESDESRSLFNLLPQPSSKKFSVIEEDDDEFLHKKETVPNIVKPKARITVPSLSDFKDVEDSIPNKPKAPTSKKSGLLSMLPQPRNAFTSTTTSKSLIPHVLTKKPTTSTSKQKMPLPSQAKKQMIDAKKPLALDYSDDSDDDVQNDFFSMNKPVELPSEDIPLGIDEKIEDPKQKLPRSIESYFKQDVVENDIEMEAAVDDGTYHSEESSSYSTENGHAESSSNDVVLDEEAIRQLCGARGKRRREDIQIVDVNQQEVLADAREWLVKGLMDDTSKRVSSSKKKGNEPTNQQKRKHQITYLAHQAKANEAELQNQWANNRMSKRQTQSKYGF